MRTLLCFGCLSCEFYMVKTFCQDQQDPRSGSLFLLLLLRDVVDSNRKRAATYLCYTGSRTNCNPRQEIVSLAGLGSKGVQIELYSSISVDD